ncbi:MAG: hypothetical protein JNN02_12000 [Tabrizicola sp.]|nr:hypothetical protein [Tabrizicola sp.]
MRIALNLAVVAAVGFLAACNSEETCTNEEAMQKSTDLSAKLQEMAATDPTKLAELAPKVQELATKAAGSGEDLQAACKAMDEMMAELSK